MTERGYKDDENRALAIASLNLVKSLMNSLERKGLLDDREIHGVLDETLTALEYRHQDTATDLARRIVEAIVITRDTERSSGKPD